MEIKIPETQSAGGSAEKLGLVRISVVPRHISEKFICEWCHKEVREVLVLSINEKNRYYCLDCLRNHLIYF